MKILSIQLKEVIVYHLRKGLGKGGKRRGISLSMKNENKDGGLATIKRYFIYHGALKPSSICHYFRTVRSKYIAIGPVPPSMWLIPFTEAAGGLANLSPTCKLASIHRDARSELPVNHFLGSRALNPTVQHRCTIRNTSRLFDKPGIYY